MLRIVSFLPRLGRSRLPRPRPPRQPLGRRFGGVQASFELPRGGFRRPPARHRQRLAVHHVHGGERQRHQEAVPRAQAPAAPRPDPHPPPPQTRPPPPPPHPPPPP